jgi:hypothetical protein
MQYTPTENTTEIISLVYLRGEREIIVPEE